MVLLYDIKSLTKNMNTASSQCTFLLCNYCNNYIYD